MRTALFGLLTALAWGAACAASGNCAQLSTLRLPHTRITLAESVPAGAFAPAKPFSLAGPAQQPSYKALPAFCRASRQFHLCARPPNIHASDEPIVAVPYGSASFGP